MKKQRKGKSQATIKKGFLLASSSSRAANKKKPLHKNSADSSEQKNEKNINDVGEIDSVVFPKMPQSRQPPKANRIVGKSEASSLAEISEDLLCFESDSDVDDNRKHERRND